MWPTTIATTSPRSFVFYVVADVGFPGTDDSYRPLAVTFRQGHGPGPCRNGSRSGQRVLHVIQDCARIIDILTEPANRIALDAELALAVAWYRGGHYSEPERIEIDDAPQPGYDFSALKSVWKDKPGNPERPELPWAPGTREFPFVSSCLRLALNRDDTYGTRLGDVQEQPLGTVFGGNKLEYGMVVIDISDLGNVRYGIVGLEISYVADIDIIGSPCGWDYVESRMPDREPVLHLEKARSRLPLSGTRYMKKYGLHTLTDAVKWLKRQPVADLKALSYIWPRPNIGSDSSSRTRPIDSAPPVSQDAALDQAVARVIQDAVSYDGLNIETHRGLINHPNFQAHLINQLCQSPRILGDSESSTQLLRLAYAGHSHLNWVAYTNLTYENIAAALESAELRDAQALSICVDQLDGSPTPLFEVLARSGTIRDLCFLQDPARANDDKSSQLFSQICASPSGSSLLSSKNIFLTCAFSAPLRRRFWLLDPKGGRLSHASLASAFPVQHMFVRQQLVASPGDDGDEAKRFRPCHFFLGDALLKPVRLAAGFLQYCQSVVTDGFLFSFAAVSPRLPSCKSEFPGTAISPIPAENFAIPEWCSVSSVTAGGGRPAQIECWPLFQALEANSWVLLVSHEWHTDLETRHRRAELVSQGMSGDSALGVPFVRYAFLRARKRIAWPDIADSSLETLVRPESIQVVGGVKEFLRETAPEVDELLVDACFDDAVNVLRERWPAGLGPDMDFISLLDDGTAQSILKDFLQDAVYVRENLRMAMQGMPRDRNWYPELLAESSRYNLRSRRGTAEVTESATRNGAVFKSLHDLDVQGQNSLGTERPVTPPQHDEDSDL
ncbi:Proteophosphoglycan ppg4 [Madurella fahalii]|uniref:Proteophosphoglycan ppg4 n=1 Tax=Madurella fahalii TaxID=1157608 RepID=A0ABQ0GHQ5_9PEZI